MQRVYPVWITRITEFQGYRGITGLPDVPPIWMVTSSIGSHDYSKILNYLNWHSVWCCLSIGANTKSCRFLWDWIGQTPRDLKAGKHKAILQPFTFWYFVFLNVGCFLLAASHPSHTHLNPIKELLSYKMVYECALNGSVLILCHPLPPWTATCWAVWPWRGIADESSAQKILVRLMGRGSLSIQFPNDLKLFPFTPIRWGKFFNEFKTRSWYSTFASYTRPHR